MYRSSLEEEIEFDEFIGKIFFFTGDGRGDRGRGWKGKEKEDKISNNRKSRRRFKGVKSSTIQPPPSLIL